MILAKANLLGRMIKWLVELNKFNIRYDPSLTFKAHVVANFVVDFNGKPYFSEDNDIIGNIDIICGHIITHTPPRIKVCLNP